MARRIAWPYWFRAESATLVWPVIADQQLAQIRQHGVDVRPRVLERLKTIRELRPTEIQLRWACAKELGVPAEPFVVWRRQRHDEPREVDVRQRRAHGGLALSWGRVAAYVEVECDVVDPTRAVGLLVTRGGIGLRETVGADAVPSGGGPRVTLTVRCSGGTRALLVNGFNPSVRIITLQRVLEDDAWKAFERVGLPVDDPWPGTSYDTREQGLADDPVDPVEAAMRRLQRGGPPLGWYPVTSTARTAPLWVPPDYERLLKEVRGETLPRIERIYRPAMPPHQQHLVLDTGPVDGPEGSSLPATAQLPPLSLLTLPAAGDPFLALALGFGTSYLQEPREGLPAVGGDDLMVTADYTDLPDRSGPATMAAYVPSAPRHVSTATPTTVTAVRDGLGAPETVDGPWRETIRVSWDRPEPTAALGQGTGAALARFASLSEVEAECLLPVRAAGDFRPLLPVPDGPPDDPAFRRTGMVDAVAAIPIGSGGRQPGYPVAWQDVFGVWSRWQDALYAGTEPDPPRPRVIAMALTSVFAGSSLCPATLELELAVGWEERTPSALEVRAVLFPMLSSTTSPPAGVTPFGAAPPGCFRRDAILSFSGAQLVGGPGLTVEHLDSAGENVVAPGPAQGEEGRRYRLRFAVPVLDYATTSRWGIALWTRTQLLIGIPSGLSPSAGTPALTSAASPVPVAPIPPPLPPGVPMGSAPDAQGRSHARVHWSVPGGADLDPSRGVIVWEVAETSLRQTVGLAPRAPEGTLPGVRLQQLWDAYDALAPDRRRALFRRLTVLPGSARETDVPLPKGSTDIHLFTVTTLSRSGVESPWPAPSAGQDAHDHLQAVAAPRLRAPSEPRVASVLGAGGTVTLSLSSSSRIPVREFRVFRTRSAVAARSFESMGPPFAVVPAAPSGSLAYAAEWSGPFDASWDDWFVRAVAVPVDAVPVEAVRGRPSPACEPVLVTVLPAAGPDLAPLVALPLGAGSLVLVTTSTAAPSRPVGLGSHRVSVAVSGPGAGGVTDVAPVPLEAVPIGPVADGAGGPPAGADPGAVLVAGARSGGRTPLAVWLTRPDPHQPLDVVVRLADPLSRLTEQRVTVPPVADSPPSLELIDVVTIVGRGVVLRIRSDADIEAEPPYVLLVQAQRTRRPFPIAPLPPPVRARFELDDIPTRPGGFPSGTVIQAVRVTTDEPHEYQVFVQLAPPLLVTLTLAAPDGERAQVVVPVPGP
ncbi:hypothetical protein E1212_14255 [Jiangella ureilytica]|uniref:Uncharacterized protein n=1 Tax=Jiangella ureilytica TaxID=2530374 RepID=A0A4R4RLX0_9ACTN|nr:hypothetical protein [Jiangella ureilytica]TDC50721.1 hypothetical protein E1212_14255 [Jiangella ureilytica]